MKAAIPFLLFLPLLGSLVAQPAETSETPELQSYQQNFLNLPEEKRKEFMKNFAEAQRMLQEKRVLESLDWIGKAEQIFKDSPELHNLRGSCYVFMRAFDKALAEFQTAAGLAKGDPSIGFNIGEMYFVKKEYGKAIEEFEKLLKTLPENKKLSMGRLVEFKILLSQLKLGRKDEAIALAGKYDIMDDSPFHCYAKAALAYDADDKREAAEWIFRAARIFRNPQMDQGQGIPSLLIPWHDTLEEFGYIASFYGTGEETEQ